MTVSSSGANSKISWSKNGFIAYSDLSSTTNLSITKLESVKGSSWRISPKKTYQIKTSPLSKLSELTTVKWSNSGNELALIDVVGNLTVLGIGVIKGNQSTAPQVACFEDIEIFYQDHVFDIPSMSTKIPLVDAKDYFTGVIAFKWLNIDKPIISNSPAIRKNDTYTYAVHQYKSYGALHTTQGKSGFFLIRRNGSLNFYYQTLSPIIEYKKISVNLENDVTWLEKASIGYNRDGSVIVTTYNSLNHILKVYKILIDFGSETNLKPVLKIERLISQSNPIIGENGLRLEVDSLEIISANFSHGTELDILISFKGPGVVGGETLLQKYQISNEFKNLRFQRDSISTSVEGYSSLQLVSSVIIEEEILNINFKNFDFLIVLVTTRGNIQIRHRKSLQLHSETPLAITYLGDVGFKFVKPDIPPEEVTVSPCLSGYITLNDHQLKFYPVSRPESSTWTEEEFIQVSGGIAYTFAFACFTNTSSDEFIATTQYEISKIKDMKVRETLILRILQESHKALNFSLDHSKEQIDRLLVNPPIQKLLSLQYSLGKYVETTEQGAIALGILNLRLLSFSIMLSMRTMFHQQQRIARKGNVETLIDAVYRSENLLSTIGIINWFIEFLVFSVQEFIELINNGEHKTIILALFLSKIPRSLMIYSIAGIKRIDGLLTNKVEETRKNPNSQHLSQLHLELLENNHSKLKNLLGLIDLDLFEKFLNQIESMYLNKSTDPIQSLKVEQELIFQNKIPELYKPSIPSLLFKFQENFISLNLSDLYFHDTKWLNFNIYKNKFPEKTILSQSDKIPILFNLNDEIIDDVTKVQIIEKDRLKKCVKCEYVTSDSNEDFCTMGKELTGTAMNHWPFAFHRTCICGSSWAYINDDEIAV